MKTIKRHTRFVLTAVVPLLLALCFLFPAAVPVQAKTGISLDSKKMTLEVGSSGNLILKR